jgi:hypothetical protein
MLWPYVVDQSPPYRVHLHYSFLLAGACCGAGQVSLSDHPFVQSMLTNWIRTYCMMFDNVGWCCPSDEDCSADD